MGMLLASFIFLSAFETIQGDMSNKNIWMLYFSSPKDNSLDFIIENNSQNKIFHWQILLDKIVVTEGDSSVSLGDKKTITVPNDDIDLSNRKITIVVSDVNNNKKEIYKHF